jgi:hypothetical protein
MPDEREVLIKMLRQSGMSEAADMATVILPASQAPTPEIPATPVPAAAVEAAQQLAGPQPPPGKAPLQTLADIEALSDKEFDARYDEVQAALGGGA